MREIGDSFRSNSSILIVDILSQRLDDIYQSDFFGLNLCCSINLNLPFIQIYWFSPTSCGFFGDLFCASLVVVYLEQIPLDIRHDHNPM